MNTARPTLDAIVRAALDASGADRGWLLATDGDDLVVVAAVAAPTADGVDPNELLGRRRPRSGAAGYAAGSGQPAALRPRSDDLANDGAGGAEGVPTGILAAPCVGGAGAGAEVVGVIELVRGDGGFGFDDVESVAWLADIAGAALVESGVVQDVPAPAELAAALAALAGADARRYAAVARVVAALL